MMTLVSVVCNVVDEVAHKVASIRRFEVGVRCSKSEATALRFLHAAGAQSLIHSCETNSVQPFKMQIEPSAVHFCIAIRFAEWLKFPYVLGVLSCIISFLLRINSCLRLDLTFGKIALIFFHGMFTAHYGRFYLTVTFLF